MDETSQDWHESFREWCFFMGHDAKGRATLSNLLYDAQEKRISKRVLGRFLKDVASRWKDNVEKSVKNIPQKLPSEIFWEAVRDAKETYLCKGMEVPPAVPEQCSRIMSTKDLQAYNLLPMQNTFAIRGPLTSGQVKLLEKLGLGDTHGYMKGALPFAWVTKTEVLTKAREKEEHPADAVRKHLGLDRLREDEYLVEVKYPEDKLTDKKLRIPTSLEGCPSLIFRAKLGDDGWGCAVNLETLEDGYPEAVHWQIEFTSDFKVADLGRLPPLRVYFEWDAFLEKLPRPWAFELWEELVEYVQ